MWTEHTEYDEYHKLQLCTVFRYQHNNTLGKISSNYRYRKIIFFSISHTPNRNLRLVYMRYICNKPQNVMFSKTRTSCMDSNSAARARGTRVQRPKRWNTVTHHLLICIIIFKGVLQCDQHLPKFIMRYICILLSTKRSLLRVSAKIKAPTFIHFSVVILPLFCKIK